MNIEKIDGRRYFYYFYAGALRLLDHQQEINRLNVFPVPDADTGTNLASTIRSIIDTIRPDRSYKMTTTAVAEAALTGARGNSGIIFAQFLSGISQETSNCQDISLKDFVLSIKNSIRYLYEAIANPVEGTMLTVIREWAEYMYHNHSMEDFKTLFMNSYEVAVRSLAATSEKIKELTSTSVVDAGAKGFVVFLEGIVDLLKSNNIREMVRLEIPEEIETIDVEVEHTDTLTYRYCTEVLIKGKGIDKSSIEKLLREHGDSIVVAGTSGTMRIHVHTNHPEVVIDQLRPMGKLVFQKADDMLLQYRVAHERKHAIALVTDSACDLPDALLEKYQITMVPIYLYLGENQYLDRVTIKPDRFYDLIEQEQFPLSTSQPNVKSFVNLYSRLLSHYDSVISVHLSSELSGTFHTAEQAAKQVMKETGRKISVMNSRMLSGGFGFLVKKTAEAIEKGLAHEQIKAAFDQWIKRVKVYATVGSMKQLIRSGRVGQIKGWLGRLIHLRPVISIDEEGRAVMLEKAFSRRGGLKNIVKKLQKDLDFARADFIILHANVPEEAAAFAREIEQATGRKPERYQELSPVIGTHLGKGTIGIAYIRR